MRITTTTLVLLVAVAYMLPMTADAQAMGAPKGATQLLPPPPGPYVSSQPKLAPSKAKQQGNRMNIPFIGKMPVAPGYYMPGPTQFPFPPQQWRGPSAYQVR